MKIIDIKILLVLLVLFSGSFSYGQNTTDELKGTSAAYLKAEGIKAVESNLVKALGAEANSGAVTKAMTKFWEAAKGLDKKQVQALAQRFSNASKTSIKQLVNLSPSQLGSYVRDVTSKIKLDPKTLKNIIYGAGNKAGNATLRILSEMDNVIAETGTVSVELLKKMRSEAAGLDPKQASAFYDLLKSKLSKDWTDLKDLKNPQKGLGKYVGTVVDGAFVLSDAYDIYYSDEEAEVKAIKATGKIIDYSASTGAGVASAALGGGLGAGLVIAFSANRVSTLYTEIAMLQKEREDAANAEQNVKINNGILVRRQLVNISSKLKLGQIDNAKFLLIKVEKYLFKHKIENKEMLLKLHNELEEKAKKAERNELINQLINTTRRPYNKALSYYRKGVELNLAKRNATEALKILQSNLKSYPEIHDLKAIPNTKKLLSAIKEKVDGATKLVITGVSAPKKVYVGQYIHILANVQGGIPFYRAFGPISGNISNDSEVTFYWEAPSKPGNQKFRVKLKDCMGSTASFPVSIEVVEKTYELLEDSEATGEQIVDNSPKGLAGCWVGWNLCGDGIIHCPMFQYFFKIGTKKDVRFYSIQTYVQIMEGKYYVTCFDGSCDDNIRKNRIKGDGWSITKFRYPNIPEIPETSDEMYKNHIQGLLEKIKNTKDADERYSLQSQISGINVRINQKIWSRIFYETALEWTKENKWENFNYPTDEDQNYNGYDDWWMCPEEVLVQFKNALKAKSSS